MVGWISLGTSSMRWIPERQKGKKHLNFTVKMWIKSRGPQPLDF